MKKICTVFLALATIWSAAPAFADIGEGKVAREKGEYLKAIEIFSAESKNGNPDGDFLIGQMYAAGQGVKASLPRAITLYERAASRGHTEAAYTIGQMYLRGEGLPQSQGEAYKWFKKAAESQKNPYAEAMTKLGYMHYRGLGTYRDINTALDWLSKGANLGSALAYDYLEDMYQEQVITREQALFGLEPPTFQPLTERGEVFKANFDAFIETMKTPSPGQPKLVIDGQTYFFERDGEFLIVAPFVKVLYPGNQEVYIGTVRAFAKPEAKDIYSVSVSFPGRIEIGYGRGLVNTLITTRERRFTGVWSATDRSLVAYEVSAIDVGIDHNLQATPVRFSAGKLFMNQTASENPDGLWGMTQNFTMSDIRTNNQTEDACCLFIGEAKFTGDYKNLRITEYNTLFEELGYDRATGLWRPEKMNPDFKVPDTLPPFFDAATVNASLSGLRLTDKEGTEVAELPSATFSLNMGGSDEEGATVDIAFTQSPLEVQDKDLAGGLPPASVSLNLNITRLPSDRIRQLLISYIADYTTILKDAGVNADFAMFNKIMGDFVMRSTETLNQLATDVAEAQPVLTIKDFKVTVEDTGFSATGSLTAEPGAEHGALGTVTVTVTNLEKLLRETSDGEALPPAAQALLSMGDPTATTEGATKTVFLIEVPKTGPILLNGTDLAAIQAALAPPPPEPAPEGAPPGGIEGSSLQTQ